MLDATAHFGFSTTFVGKRAMSKEWKFKLGEAYLPEWHGSPIVFGQEILQPDGTFRGKDVQRPSEDAIKAVIKDGQDGKSYRPEEIKVNSSEEFRAWMVSRCPQCVLPKAFSE
jgi:hypothetical protein